jgi:hypothetical protein
LTLAALTPGTLSSARCTRALQAAQVMPDTGMLTLSRTSVLMDEAAYPLPFAPFRNQ